MVPSVNPFLSVDQRGPAPRQELPTVSPVDSKVGVVDKLVATCECLGSTPGDDVRREKVNRFGLANDANLFRDVLEGGPVRVDDVVRLKNPRCQESERGPNQ